MSRIVHQLHQTTMFLPSLVGQIRGTIPSSRNLQDADASAQPWAFGAIAGKKSLPTIELTGSRRGIGVAGGRDGARLRVLINLSLQ